MGRSKSGGGNPVSLFPFLSILACIIGTLVLLISAVAICQIETPADKALIKRVEKYRELEQQQAAMDQSLAAELPRLHELEQYKEALRKLEALAARLRADQQKKLRENKTATTDLALLLEQMKKSDALLANLETRKKKLEATLRDLQNELQRRKMVQDAPTVCIMPAKGGPQGQGATRPVFVEANAQGVILDPNGKRELVPQAQITTDPRFKQAVDAIAADRKKVLVFLIREDGIASHGIAETFARTQSALVAKLPIIGAGKLDLSRF